jgi:hypothetical protein
MGSFEMRRGYFESTAWMSGAIRLSQYNDVYKFLGLSWEEGDIGITYLSNYYIEGSIVLNHSNNCILKDISKSNCLPRSAKDLAEKYKRFDYSNYHERVEGMAVREYKNFKIYQREKRENDMSKKKIVMEEYIKVKSKNEYDIVYAMLGKKAPEYDYNTGVRYIGVKKGDLLYRDHFENPNIDSRKTLVTKFENFFTQENVGKEFFKKKKKQKVEITITINVLVKNSNSSFTGKRQFNEEGD